MVAFGGDGGGDSLELLRREVESQRARIRELEATNRAQEEALSQRDRQLALASLPAPFIRDMQEAEYGRFSLSMRELAKAHSGGALWTKVGETLNPAEMVTDVLTAFRQGHDRAATQDRLKHALTTWLMQVNGDVQRGKSAAEAFLGLVAHLVNQSDECADRCFTVLVTVMRAWSRALKGNATRLVGTSDDAASERASEASDEEEEDEAVDCGHVPVAELSRANLQHAKYACQQGGIVVIFRSGSQLDIAQDLVHELNRSRRRGRSPAWPIVVMDESDKMLGSCNSAGVSLPGGKTPFQYELAITELCGWGAGGPGSNPPVLVVMVSGTNIGCFYWAAARLGLCHLRSERRLFELLDVVSFRRATPQQYIGYDRFTRFAGSDNFVAAGPSSEYVNEGVLEMWSEVANTPYACLLDCTTPRVHNGVPHNMQTHASTVLDCLDGHASLPGLAPQGMAVIFVHGGHKTFLGMLGLRFSSPACDDGADKIEALADAMLAASGVEPDRTLARDLGEAADGLAEEMDDEGAIAVSALLPLIHHLERRAARETGTYRPCVPEACKGKSPLSTEHIGIALFLVRHFFPGIPVAVVGYSMIRRCLSIVAVDIFATETRPLNAVTHGIISSSANGADAGQQTQRAATTLTAFHAQHGFTEIKMLCPELVWDMTAGHVTFNQLPCFDSDLNDAAGRRQLLRRLEASVEAGDAPALADEQWEQARAFERQVADVGAHPRLLRIARALAAHIDMPLDTRRLIQLAARPMFQGGAGAIERDLADVHANLSDIKEGREPADFRSGTTRRSRRAAPTLSGFAQLMLQMLAQRGVYGTAAGPANESAASSAMTEREVRRALALLYPHRIGQPGFTPLTAGCGFALKGLYDKAHVCRRRRWTGARGRQPMEYWLPAPRGAGAFA